ncbi:MAG: TonB-dependent receptor, partial [Gammaproteobacteria bacterium]|nr:TonB-dependent receptor [Gammaproteobacteria bacterium]
SNDGSGLWLNTENDTLSESNYNFWAGGALIKDKLFAFGLLNPRVVKSTNIGNTGYSDTDRTDLFYGLKLDYYMSDEHILEFTAFGDDRDYDVDTGTINNGIQTFVGPYVREIGGNNMSIQYTGVVSDQVTISAMYGVNKFSNSSFADGAYNVPCAFERTTGQNYSGYVLCTNVNQEDEREQFRFDVDWYVGDHTLRFGIDTQTLTANESTGRSGGFVYRYDTDFYGAGDSRVRVGVYENHGSFETEDAAIYVQDTWEVTPDLTLKLGMRNDAFANYNADGEKFIDIKDQWAPRLGLAWDPTGSGEEKVYASFGKYYLGVATNTNVRLAGAELFTRTFCHTDGPDANGVPINLNTCGAPTVYGDGQQRSTGESVDATIEPMFSEETIVGYQKQYDSWIAGVKWTYRDLGESIEDIAIDAGFDAFLADQGQTCFNCSGFHYYVLTNPGSGVTTITTDPNGGTNPQTYTIPNSYLGYPKAKRTYRAWDFEVTHPWDGDYSLTLAYTWSHSEGNNEGWVRSDNGQTDAGLTTNFDQPGLTDHGYGDLPNDRRHQFKAYGTFALNDNLTTGFSFSYATGRPYGAFGVHPTDMFASWYGSSSFYMSTDTYGESIAVPRGSLGRLPDTWKLDVNLKYNTKLMGGDATIGIDIFNLLNNDEMTEINEVADYVAGYRDPANGDYSYVGMPDPNFGLPDAFQTPRTVRLSASWKF